MVQRGGDWAASPGPFFAVPNVIAHPSAASVSIIVLLYSGDPWLCGFNVPVEGLTNVEQARLVNGTSCYCLAFVACGIVRHMTRLR